MTHLSLDIAVDFEGHVTAQWRSSTTRPIGCSAVVNLHWVGMLFFGQSSDRRFAIGAGLVMTAAYTALAALVVILFDVVYGSPARPSDLCPALPSDVELVRWRSQYRVAAREVDCVNSANGLVKP